MAAGGVGESKCDGGGARETNENHAGRAGDGAGVTRAMPNPELGVGEKVKLMTRPEAVDVLGDGETRVNEVSGTLREIIVGGGATKLFVELPGGATLQVTQLTRSASKRLIPGAELRLGWEQHAAVVLKHAEVESGL